MYLSIRRRITAADNISLTNALLGFAAVLAIAMGYSAYAAVALVVTAVLDYIDGRVARRLGSNKEWGRQIDSLCDVVAFGVAPAFLAWPVIVAGTAGTSVYLALIAGFTFPSLLIVAGILRLARYNISTAHGMYVGMPITMNGLIFPALWWATVGLAAELRAAIMIVACVTSAGLMVSTFMIRKR